MLLDCLLQSLLFLVEDLDIRFCFRKLLGELYKLGDTLGKFVWHRHIILIKTRHLIFKRYLAESTLHHIRDNGRVVPHEGVLGVGGVRADLLVGVTESATDGLWETDLLTRLKEVLASEDVLWSKLTEVLGGGNLTGEEGRREANTLLHTTAVGGGWTSGRWAGGRSHLDRSVLTLLDRILRLVVHSEEQIDQHGDGEHHKNVLGTTLLHHVLY